jgi:ubiquinone biosynthesis protein UbiJ
MLESLQALVAPAALQRLTLVLNHVLAAEPVAVARLKPHAGRCIGLQMSQWPSLLPPPPAIVFCITRAGLLEWVEQPDAAVPDLHVSVAAGNPAAVALGLLAGARPPIAIQGDAALAAEPVAVARLKPHAGRCIGLQMSQWPSLLPPPPAIVFCITRAGLLEWVEQPGAAVPDLHVSVAAGNPAAVALGLLAGARPPVAIQGDAALAADVNWLADNLRWDVAADLERLFGPAVAHQLAGFGRTLAEGLRRLVQAGGSLAAGRQPR